MEMIFLAIIIGIIVLLTIAIRKKCAANINEMKDEEESSEVVIKKDNDWDFLEDDKFLKANKFNSNDTD